MPAREAALTKDSQQDEDIDARYFDAAFYLDTYPDIRQAGVDPLHHYRHWGAFEGRDPNRFFSTSWYLLQNPDVLEAGINPLHHFVLFGLREGRNPHPNFDLHFYVNQVPEAAADPLLYHLRTGHAQGLPTERQFRLEDAMPAGGPVLAPPAGLRVDVVVPVYRGLAQTKRCLTSLLRDPLPGLGGPLHRIIVVDDASPEPALSRYLDRLAARRFIHLLRNPRNRGFVASVNRGIKAAGRHDVVLLNADTEVPAGWLARLAGHAYSHPRVATVSPFSNNATLCSYPSVPGGPLAFGESLARIDAACAAANAGRAVTVPTTVGFCMYLRRDALEAVGVLDEKSFGRGYGEENDYCMRAAAAGWRHLLACDLFVYHEGEVSFGAEAPERLAAQALLDKRWPEYRDRVGVHIRLDEARPYRFATTLQLFATNGLPTILMVQHAYEGGIGQYVRSLAERAQGRANILLLRATMDGRGIRLAVPAAPGHPDFFIPFPELEMPKEERGEARDPLLVEQEGRAALLADLLRLLAPLRIARVHVQHWVGLKLDLQALIRALAVPFDVTIHDWFAICPRINLLPVADGPSCGEPEPAACDRCIQMRDDTVAHDIIGWRAEHAWLLRLADRVLCATPDSIERLARYGLAARAVLAPVEAMPDRVPPCPTPRPSPKPLRGRAAVRPLRVAVLGVLADHKGAPLVTALAETAEPGRIAITLIGKAERSIPAAARHALSETGAYEPEELPALIDRVDPEVIWFPAGWPETWSYTLTQAILSGRPILASDIGAFRVRLAAHPRARLIAPGARPEEALAAMVDLARRASAARGQASRPAPARIAADFYDDAYHAPLLARSGTASRDSVTDLRAAGRLAVVLVPERLDVGTMGACAYIRALLPLSHPLAGAEVEVTIADAAEALRLRPDLFLVHRHAVPEEAEAVALLAHAKRFGIPLLYDLDDDLAGLPADHPEAERLRPRNAAVIRLLAGADRVHVSTALLAERVTPFVRGGRAHVDVVPNGLDERLWLAQGGAAPLSSHPLAAAGVQPGPVRLLYMGTATHGADLDLILPALTRLHETFGERIAIDLVGVLPPGDLPAFVKRVDVPRRAGLTYPAFVAWLTDRQRRQPWSIGLAPLVDSAFNRCKSPIKMLDYAALGLATVASDIAAYNALGGCDLAAPPGLVEEGKGVLLAASEADWFHALARLVRRPEERLRLAEWGRAALVEQGTLAAQGTLRRALLGRLAGRTRLMQTAAPEIIPDARPAEARPAATPGAGVRKRRTTQPA
ncbi:MAG TPA: glycosyltransferase [Acidisoma sp.]|uniref:glycosyltransferase n=1 Tax=Acidisoma sp. TaxID=1872115 RepID=UPI002D158A72|nr:glycosyltransferase [Acidisoma sp.]HTI03170.1 glycosyltransferase [Acidisoma sp.]